MLYRFRKVSAIWASTPKRVRLENQSAQIAGARNSCEILGNFKWYKVQMIFKKVTDKIP